MPETNPVPGALQRAWGLRERPTRGPKPTLSVDLIVTAAVGVARAEGFAAVSMPRLAAELSTSAMTLYRYVANKDELVLLMLEAAAGEPPHPKAPDEAWRAAVERWAHATFALYLAEPWILQVPIAAPPATPRQLAWMETGLRALAGTRLAEREKLSLLMLVLGYVRYDAMLRGQMVEAARAQGGSVEAVNAEFGGLMRHLVRADRFPMLRQAIDAGAMDEPQDPAAYFGFGLARILDGMAAFIDVKNGSETGLFIEDAG
ncbi:TetR family transcriptional regulator [Catellatospora sp. TT07R-123]|uniref:TetR/AcrR family transcriptional regulator n=1 Tax=Catellatospora sp. TT07R-123 TaxID=2733863 RepID=UPI001B0DE85C|nr:TetR/AcrR family transcriptional regulator [Catellatospora sp. TT07R-123]GHJ43832.1 TetR family transcriptional regulator [Catellatospora sp. TT07R-123]